MSRSARDDVVDVFDVVFADLQRNARNRGQRLRVNTLLNAKAGRTAANGADTDRPDTAWDDGSDWASAAPITVKINITAMATTRAASEAGALAVRELDLRVVLVSELT